MGYIKMAYDLSGGENGDSYDTVFFGWCLIFSPIGIPLYWIGKAGKWVIENNG